VKKKKNNNFDFYSIVSILPLPPLLRARSTKNQSRIYSFLPQLAGGFHGDLGDDGAGRVADLVYLWPDPDPANLNFSNHIRTLLAITMNQFKFFSYRSDFYLDFFNLEKEKKSPENVKKLHLKKNCPCIYNFN